MLSHDDAVNMETICSILYRIGITANYIGFSYIAYAVLLCIREPERLQLVTKWLYPAVAEHYGTNWKAVERNIRAMTTMVWNEKKSELNELTQCSLKKRPGTADFLVIVVHAVLTYK